MDLSWDIYHLYKFSFQHLIKDFKYYQALHPTISKAKKVVFLHNIFCFFIVHLQKTVTYSTIFTGVLPLKKALKKIVSRNAIEFNLLNFENR